jgi:hypothetical protein
MAATALGMFIKQNRVEMFTYFPNAVYLFVGEF